MKYILLIATVLGQIALADIVLVDRENSRYVVLWSESSLMVASRVCLIVEDDQAPRECDGPTGTSISAAYLFSEIDTAKERDEDLLKISLAVETAEKQIASPKLLAKDKVAEELEALKAKQARILNFRRIAEHLHSPNGLEFDPHKETEQASFKLIYPAWEKAQVRSAIPPSKKITAKEVKLQNDFQFIPIPGTKIEMQVTEVTESLWSKINGPYQDSAIAKSDVNITEVRKFIEALNLDLAKEGWWYRLPTGEEWEIAARGGTSTKYSFGDDPNLMNDYGWSNNNESRRRSVGLLKPNPFGLYDMHGNVCEWTSDLDGGVPVHRGGSYYDSPARAESSFRAKFGGKSVNIGFRLVRERADSAGNKKIEPPL